MQKKNKIIEISALPFKKSIFKFKKDVKNCLENNIKDLHYDVMDNIFVNNLSFHKLQRLNYLIKKNINVGVHLMVSDVEKYVKKLINKKLKYITFHCEAIDISLSKKIINLVQQKNIKCGIAIKPNSDLEKYKELIQMSNFITVMSVEPGFGGQKYIENSEVRAEQIKKMANDDCIIQIDGGITDTTMLKAKICDNFVSGSFLYNQKEKYNDFIKILNNK